MPSLTPLFSPSTGSVNPDAEGAQRRVEARSNIFVVAVLASDNGSAPVRIRNMSRSGALIEGGVIPPENASVRLSRGSLSVRGQIMWRRENRAGVHFESAVAVADWLPGGKGASGQQRVDEIVYSYKAEVGAMRPVQIAPPEQAFAERPDLAAELLELRTALDAVAEELAGDEATAVRHPDALQAIDMAAQRLEKLAQQFGSELPGLAL